MTIRVLYQHDGPGWSAESPDLPDWTVTGETCEDVRALVEDGVSFALAAAAEDRGETFDEARFADVTLEHFLPAPA